MSVEANPHVNTELEPRDYHNLHIEPAKHPLPALQTTHIEEQLSKGWYESSVWENKVALLKRLSEYQPKYLLVDGLTPFGTMDEDAYTFENQLLNIWLRLPGPPKSFRSDGQVNVVAGDFSSQYYRNEFNTAHGKEFSEELVSDSNDDHALSKLSGLAEFGVASGVGSVIVYAIHKVLENASYQKHNPVVDFAVSRRAFIGKLLASATLISGVGRLAVNAVRTESNAAYSDRLWKRNFWLRVHRLAEPILLRGVEMNARTASSVLKMKDTLRRHDEPMDTHASALFGSSHADESLDSLKSDEHCKKLIFDYLSRVKKILDTLKKDYPEVDDLGVMKTLCTLIADTEVYNVKNPTLKDQQLGWEVLNQYIEITDRFSSPSVLKITEEFIRENYDGA